MELMLWQIVVSASFQMYVYSESCVSSDRRPSTRRTPICSSLPRIYCSAAVFCCTPLARVALTRWPLIRTHNFSLEAYSGEEWPVWRLQPALLFCWSTPSCRCGRLSPRLFISFMVFAWVQLRMINSEEGKFGKKGNGASSRGELQGMSLTSTLQNTFGIVVTL